MVLIQLLNLEARLVEVQMRLVADHKLTRIQRRKYRVLHGPNCMISGTGAVPVQKKDSKAAFEILLKTLWDNPHTVNSYVNKTIFLANVVRP